MKKQALWLVTWAAMGLAPQLVSAPLGQFWPADGLTKVLRTDQPRTNSPAILHLSGARGEIVSGQAVFRPDKDWAAVRTTITDFRHQQSGTVMAASAARLQWVRYIEIKRNTDGIPPAGRNGHSGRAPLRYRPGPGSARGPGYSGR
jgi:hypothetical protein